ncbi:MAG: hypothetical protein U1A27_07885 [Phycisphaerae bacterium]
MAFICGLTDLLFTFVGYLSVVLQSLGLTPVSDFLTSIVTSLRDLLGCTVMH